MNTALRVRLRHLTRHSAPGARSVSDSTRDEGASVTQLTDVLQAVQSIIDKGYDREYRVKDGNLVDLEPGSPIDPRTIRVDAALHLESGHDAEDASNIYAITEPATAHPFAH